MLFCDSKKNSGFTRILARLIDKVRTRLKRGKTFGRGEALSPFPVPSRRLEEDKFLDNHFCPSNTHPTCTIHGL